MTGVGTITARATGVLAGLALCAAILEVSRVEPSTELLGLHLDVTLVGTGALAVPAPGPLVQVRNLLPGEDRAVEADGQVRNQTGRNMMVRLRAVPSTVEVDELLNLEIFAGDRLLYAGTLGRLREWTAESFQIGVGQLQPLRVRAHLPPTVTGGYQGRMERISLELSEPPGV
jgi:hypothetical protein